VTRGIFPAGVSTTPVTHFSCTFGPQHEHDAESAARLATHFFATFPQLEGLRFTHSWGGAIDTCSRFSAFWGTAYDGRAGYVTGYTGLGVGASRFGAATLLDHAIFTDEHHAAARELYADTLEQLGYGAENGTWRNFFLSGATDLRDGNFGTPSVPSAPPIPAPPASA